MEFVTDQQMECQPISHRWWPISGGSGLSLFNAITTGTGEVIDAGIKSELWNNLCAKVPRMEEFVMTISLK